MDKVDNPDNETFQELKKFYKSQDKIVRLIEVEGVQEQSMEDYYVKLSIIINNDVSGLKKEIDIEKIFDRVDGANSNDVGKILIIGGAGVGKSTLLQYMVYQWSIGKIWQEKFKQVYRLNLKTLLDAKWKENYPKKLREDLEDGQSPSGDTLLKCLAHYSLDSKISLNKLEQAMDNKDRILLLLDGYDEISHLKTDKKSEFHPIFDAIWSHKHVVLTSRPNAVDEDLKKKVDINIENTGLD